MSFRILAQTFSRTGFADPKLGQRIVVAEEQDGTRWATTGYFPCGECWACQSGLVMSCGQQLSLDHPLSPMVSAPNIPEALQPTQLVALIGIVGPAYQAAAMAGFVAGDTVFIIGADFLAEATRRLYVAMGFRPVVLAAGKSSIPQSQREFPSARCHIVDLVGSAQSIDYWRPLAPFAMTATINAPRTYGLFAVEKISTLFAGQTTLRWVQDLHPQLAPELASLLLHQRIEIAEFIETRTGDPDSNAASLKPEITNQWSVWS